MKPLASTQYVPADSPLVCMVPGPSAPFSFVLALSHDRYYSTGARTVRIYLNLAIFHRLEIASGNLHVHALRHLIRGLR